VLKPSQALETHRQAIREAVARYPTANPRVFGSASRGLDTDGSDLDVLVDTLPGATLLHLGGLYNELNSLLGVPVDLVTVAELPNRIRAKVLAEAVPI
jgi:predicted nucleotidyltransferase